MKTYGGSVYIDPRILDFGTSWSFTPRSLYPQEKSPQYSLGWLGPRDVLDNVEKRKFLTRPGLELQPVASRYSDCAILSFGQYLVTYINDFMCCLLRIQLSLCLINTLKPSGHYMYHVL
jgi:hypothetical protein